MKYLYVQITKKIFKKEFMLALFILVERIYISTEPTLSTVTLFDTIHSTRYLNLRADM